ncbi:substrate-binding periplasmic protein [Shewanella gelidii]|uniref:Solute-binding protein family 3/N-terminal domain-containing protein n=1 Tax=Shewanella gelidii TaxID=1642821 RepID=A0A917NBP7_9GAMM|nr:transporter substrate-binding domain-containing protein [Shewanella gelidii]MCL1098591.1 transporter substrate-binding domain-containing protein [Shewanella gelidii]GGI86847.1 hypothetical protein GCM10009332_25200 [Shewanella gelidii]
MFGSSALFKAFVTLLMFVNVWAASAFAQNKPVIQVLTYEEAPFAKIKNNHKQGFIVDLVAELFKRAKLDYRLDFLPLKRILVTTRLNEYYCALPVERSQEREVTYKWVSPVLVSRYGLFSQTDNKLPLVTLNDAKPYVIGSFLGSGVAEYLQGQGFTVEVTARSEQNIRMLQHKRIDLWAAEIESAKQQMTKNNASLGKPELVFYTSIRAMACHRSIPDTALENLQSALTQMYQDGFMRKLYEKYNVPF